MNIRTIHSSHPAWSADDIWYFLTENSPIREDSLLYISILYIVGEVA